MALFPLLGGMASVMIYLADGTVMAGDRQTALVAGVAWIMLALIDLLLPARVIHRTGLATLVPLVLTLMNAWLWSRQWSALSVGVLLIAFPVVLCAFLLRRPGAVVVTVAGAVAGTLAVLSQSRGVYQTAEHVAAMLAIAGLSALLIRNRDENERLVARLEELASVDTLTGLVTRRVLDGALTSALSSRVTGSGTALILVDLDRFKSVND